MMFIVELSRQNSVEMIMRSGILFLSGY